ncbi:MAG: hypothetical protein ACN4GG_10525 [Akkermansiaceae bacterium]
MRSLAVLFATTLLGFSVKPQEVVMEILEKAEKGEVRSGKLEELGISPHVGHRRRAIIGGYWNTLRDWMRSEDVEFEFAEAKEDGDLAAVVVNARSKKGPDHARSLSFGLKKFGGDWKVTPVPGQFRNSGLGFDDAVISRAHVLEQWMTVRQASALFHFREAELASYLNTLTEKVDPKILREAKAFEAFHHFQNAIKEGDADQVLVWLGMLERSVEDQRNWERISMAVKDGLEGKDRRDVWRLLLDSEVIKMDVERTSSDDSASILYGYISPYEVGSRREKTRVIRFHLENTRAGWRVILPAFFEYANTDSSEHRSAHREEYDYSDEKFVSKLGALFEEKYKARRAKTPAALLKKIGEELKKGEFVEFLRRLDRAPMKEGAEADDSNRLITQKYITLGEWWSAARGNDPDQFAIGVAGQHVQGDVAVGVLRFETVGSWNPTFKALWLLKKEDGWAVVPSHETLTSAPYVRKYGKDARELQEKFTEAQKKLEENYLKDLLAKIPNPLEIKEPPNEEVTRKAATAWRKELATGTISSVLEQAAMIEVPEKPSRLMRDISGAMKGARAAKEEENVLGAKSAGRFHGVSFFADAGGGLEMHCPLIIVVTTPQGPRVLADVELWYSSNQGKRIRNGAALMRLKKILSEEDFTAVKELFEWHEKLAGPVWVQWDKKTHDN